MNAGNLYSDERLRESMDLFIRNKYESALKKVENYLKDHPEDILALDMQDIFRKKLASIHLKKGYTFLSEGLEQMANKELSKAVDYHSVYAAGIEEQYSKYLATFSVRDASGRILADILNHLAPRDTEIYDISRRVRKRTAAALPVAVRMDLERLVVRVNKLKARKKWDKAVEAITEFMINNPGDIDAKLLLSEINRQAAEHFYNQAVFYLDKKKIKKGQESARQSKDYDSVWFEKKVESELQEVRMSITAGENEKARNHLTTIRHLDPENPELVIYDSLLDEELVGFLEKSMEIYRNKFFKEAAVRFDFLRLREPHNTKAHLYYQLASARAYIVERNLDKVKEHIVKALEISPGEKEAIEIFDRLQDVMEIMRK